ncbi:DUF3577 domain-containing protein [Pseudomonas syringae group genomosp. 3]|nr:DUF3577 domain-containing protein [Xanthomonas arboricola pv. corylina]
MICSSVKRFFTSNLLGVGNWTPNWGATQNWVDVVDTRVSGSEAQHLVRKCEQATKDKKKVLIGFRLGDLWTDVFTYEKGERASEQGVSVKARLLYISWIKVDGNMVYKAEPKSAESARRSQRARRHSCRAGSTGSRSCRASHSAPVRKT